MLSRLLFNFNPAYALAETFNHFKDSPFIHVHFVEGKLCCGLVALMVGCVIVSVKCLSIIFVRGKRKSFDKETSW